MLLYDSPFALVPYAAGRMSLSNLVKIAIPPLPPLAINDFSLAPMIVNAGILEPFFPLKSAQTIHGELVMETT